MSTQESLCLSPRFELAHPSLPDPGRLMRLLYSIILILFSTVDRLRNQSLMRHAIAAQFIGHDLSGFTLVTANQMLEKPFRSGPISPGLKVDINYFTVLVNSPPQIVLLAVDLYKYLIDIERIAIALMPPFQAAAINGSEFYAPQPNCFAADRDASFSEKVFYIPVAQIEAIVQPDRVGNDLRWESVTFMSTHWQILSISAG